MVGPGSKSRASRVGPRVPAAAILAALVYAPAVALASTPVFRATFDVSPDGFVYVDDAFLETRAPDHASGEWSGVAEPSGTLEIRLGTPVRETVLGMSGAWERRFATDRPLHHVRVRLRCRLTLASGFEPDEQGQLMISLDGEPVAAYGLDYVHRLVGDGDGGEPTTTGWIVVTTTG